MKSWGKAFREMQEHPPVRRIPYGWQTMPENLTAIERGKWLKKLDQVNEDMFKAAIESLEHRGTRNNSEAAPLPSEKQSFWRKLFGKHL